jgi:hypothetical protein
MLAISRPSLAQLGRHVSFNLVPNEQVVRGSQPSLAISMPLGLALNLALPKDFPSPVI